MSSVAKLPTGIKAASEVLGDKWTPQLLYFFASQSSVRFCQLQTSVGGINPRTLSARLTELEARGIIEKVPLSNTRCEYRITAKGRDLLPVIQLMEKWTKKYA